MKKLSIKLRVTLWFTSFMMVLVVMMLVFLIFMGRRLEMASYKSELMDAVQNNVTNSAIHGTVDGIWLAVYDSDGNLVNGQLPDEFEAPSDNFQDDTVYFVKNNGDKWYVYEQQLQGKHGDSGNDMWVRAVISDNSAFSSEHIIMTLAMYILPVMVIIIATGGYYIIGRALRPMKRIVATADEIGNGRDLSRRIDLGEGTDEIHVLANTFDNMFDRLESFFENEKRFTSDASHELRTPTSVIISQCEYALQNVNTIEEAQTSFSKIHDQAKKMSSLIAQLLTLARTDKGSQKLNIEELNLSELSELVLEQMQEVAQEKQIQISWRLEPDIFIMGDETLLMRMFINLAENAIHYGRQNGHLYVALTKQDEKVHISFQDDGIGISPQDIPKIWERFYQVDPSRSSINHSTSSGLGLSMVQWIVEVHEGTIKVSSEYGKGSEFIVELPHTTNLNDLKISQTK